jgi:Fe2+ or Zn2+ uptake regulation protein
MERAIRQRTTRQLTVISAAIQGDHSHPSAEDIYLRVRKVLPHISLGTVYRTLQRLVQEGTIQMLFFGERIAHYDPTLADHDHFICQQCGRVEDVWVDRDRNMDFASLVREGFTVAAHSLAIHGVCQLCGPQRVPRRRLHGMAHSVPTKRERMH